MLGQRFMEHFKDLALPNQMYPELAYHLARMLVWDNSDDREVDFFVLCLLRTSWDFKEPEAIPSILGRLHRLFKGKEPEEILRILGDEEHYKAQAKAHEVGSLTLHHVKRALRAVVPHISAEQVVQYVDSTVQALVAAVSDKSTRGAALARTATEAIASLMPTDAELQATGDHLEATDEGVLVVTPAGNFGPFPSPREALVWRRHAMAAHAQGLPLPEVPPMPVVAETQVSIVPQVAPEPSTPRVQVFSPAEALKVLLRMPPPSSPAEGNLQHRRMLELMTQGDGYRAMTVLSDLTAFQALYGRFPHFTAVLDFIMTHLALAGCGEHAGLVQLPPLLLRGVEGTGKSFFAKQLAHALGTQYVAKDMAATGSKYAISGMDSVFKGSKPGVVFDALVNGPTANPVICLNEFDKAKGMVDHGGPMDALYTLMEPEDSQAFSDEFIPVPIDASKVIWVCTANEAELPKPIMQRLEVFEIKEPTKEHCRTIATSIWNNICTTRMPRGHGFSPDLGESLLDVLSAIRPRVLKKTLEHAAGTAVQKGNRFLTPEDVIASQKRYETPVTRSMGFT